MTGDTVNIRVDFAKSTVTFTKDASSYEMPIKTDLGDLYFFVGPTHINDTIAIVWLFVFNTYIIFNIMVHPLDIYHLFSIT